MKLCYRCQRRRHADKFYKDRSRSSGLASMCKDCARTEARERHRADPEKYNAVSLRWYYAHKDHCDARQLAYYYANRERINAKRRADYKANPGPDRIRALAYYHAHKADSHD